MKLLEKCLWRSLDLQLKINSIMLFLPGNFLKNQKTAGQLLLQAIESLIKWELWHPQKHLIYDSWFMKSKSTSKGNRPWDQTNLVLNSIEKVKSGSLLFLMCMFPESNGTKFWSHSFHLQNSGILQTRMD